MKGIGKLAEKEMSKNDCHRADKYISSELEKLDNYDQIAAKHKVQNVRSNEKCLNSNITQQIIEKLSRKQNFPNCLSYFPR